VSVVKAYPLPLVSGNIHEKRTPARPTLNTTGLTDTTSSFVDVFSTTVYPEFSTLVMVGMPLIGTS